MLALRDCLDRNPRENDANILAKKIGAHPFVVKKTLDSLNNFTKGEIKSVLDDLLGLDRSIKNGTRSEEVAFDLFLSGLLARKSWREKIFLDRTHLGFRQWSFPQSLPSTAIGGRESTITKLITWEDWIPVYTGMTGQKSLSIFGHVEPIIEITLNELNHKHKPITSTSLYRYGTI